MSEGSVDNVEVISIMKAKLDVLEWKFQRQNIGELEAFNISSQSVEGRDSYITIYCCKFCKYDVA